MTPGEWIEWAGGECPVGHDVEVEVRFRDGEEFVGNMSCRAGDYTPSGPSTPRNNNWMHDGSDCDITAYRVVQS